MIRKLDFEIGLCYVCRAEVGTIIIRKADLCTEPSMDFPIKLCAKCAADLVVILANRIMGEDDDMSDNERALLNSVLDRLLPLIEWRSDNEKNCVYGL